MSSRSLLRLHDADLPAGDPAAPLNPQALTQNLWVDIFSVIVRNS